MKMHNARGFAPARYSTSTTSSPCEVATRWAAVRIVSRFRAMADSANYDLLFCFAEEPCRDSGEKSCPNKKWALSPLISPRPPATHGQVRINSSALLEYAVTHIISNRAPEQVGILRSQDEAHLSSRARSSRSCPCRHRLPQQGAFAIAERAFVSRPSDAGSAAEFRLLPAEPF